ncbi:hypothetical protein M231_02955 [Tremella mesenterica]|uniref:Uncharacterized protein n=1 Tax=Tremella mesenterica TaxID=5217 RepID=A0A4Q1BPT0_TREME|nr:hypothetical protein M231_02955 [Tremella mesenterica]
MSRCPDARLCESVFADVLHTEGVLAKVNLDMHYIGELNSSSPLGVTCEHGPLECLGNLHQLCFFHHLPLDTFYAVLECFNYADFPTRIGELSLARSCADTVGVNWEESGVGECIGRGGEGCVDSDKGCRIGKEGKKLLRTSVKETKELGVKTSCTIEIASRLKSGGMRGCVVDGGVWSGCDDGHTAADFVRVIEEEWDAVRQQVI